MLRVGRLSHIKVYCVLLFDGQLVGKDSVRLRPKHPFFLFCMILALDRVKILPEMRTTTASFSHYAPSLSGGFLRVSEGEHRRRFVGQSSCSILKEKRDWVFVLTGMQIRNCFRGRKLRNYILLKHLDRKSVV